MHPYTKTSQPRVKVAAKARVNALPIVSVALLLSVLVILINTGTASAT